MLLFIFPEILCIMLGYKFQYISCYCLSTYQVWWLTRYRYFNTSHVTVYHAHTLRENGHVAFQYISCYCLSEMERHGMAVIGISIHLMLLFIGSVLEILKKIHLFQYISCYCLSSYIMSMFHNVNYFNTSHVTVYPLAVVCVSSHSHISIHLMLLFIARAWRTVKHIA